MINNCKICTIIDNNPKQNAWDKPLYETENFFTVPSLGSLVEGWVLIFSKDHYLSLSQLSSELIDELNTFRNDVKIKLRKEFGEITSFEHGPCNEKTVLGCGVDHFHLHLVPLKGLNLLRLSKDFDSSMSWNSISRIQDLKNINDENGYLYLELPNGQKFYTSGRTAGSQFFRKVIAHELKVSDKYDWKSNPMIKNIERTIKKIQKEVAIFD